MANDSDFSLISVDADDEDDVVIQAGARGSRAQASQAATANKADGERSVAPAVDASAPAAGARESAHGGAGDADDSALAGLSDAERAEFQMQKARREARRQASRMVTTEDDLKSDVPFAHMQRTIVIVVLALLIVFLVYWFCFKPLG